MSVSTKESISLGLAHEFMGMLVRNGVTKSMITDATENKGNLGGRIIAVFLEPSATVMSPEAFISGQRVVGDFPLETPLSAIEKLTGSHPKGIDMCTLSGVVGGILRAKNGKSEEELLEQPTTIGDLLTCKAHEIASYRCFGPKKLAAIQSWLAEHHYPALEEW